MKPVVKVVIDTPMTRAIIRACALHCRAKPEDMTNKNKCRINARARLLAFHLLRSKAGITARHIAPIFDFSLDGVYDAMSQARRKQPTTDELAIVWEKVKAQLLRETQNVEIEREVRIVVDGDGGTYHLEWKRARGS